MQRCPEPDAWFALDADDGALAAHLDGCAECRGVAAMIVRADILDAPPADGIAEGLVPELLPSGAQLGRYVVRGAIGAGGMGVVLEAYDPKLDRRVALKVVRRLRDDASWARAKTRVLADAQAMARLAHPNVIAIHDLVEIGDKQLIAMEHVDGSDLEAWLATSPPRHERERVMLEAARGLAAAHDAGVIHCDVKPSNIMVGSDGRTRVTDFGLAALGGEATGGAVGTPGFLAPEVAAGGAIDARADQYAFAVTAWRVVFDAEPGERGSGAIARALARGLERHPAARWRSMHELVRAMERADRPRLRWLFALIPTFAFAIGAMLWARNEPDAVCTVDETPLWTPEARAAWVEQMRGVAGTATEKLAEDAERVWQTWHDASLDACGMPQNVADCLATTRRELTAFVAHAPASKDTSAAQGALANIPSATTCLQAPELRPSRASTR